MVEDIAVPMVATLLDEAKGFASNPLIEDAATTMLDELDEWAAALVPMRQSDG